jgi:hypothetical protein
MPCDSCKNRRFGGVHRLHHHGQQNQLLVTANTVIISLILLILIMDAIRFSETSALTRVTRRYMQEDDILHSHRRENLKSYKESYWYVEQIKKNTMNWKCSMRQNH